MKIHRVIGLASVLVFAAACGGSAGKPPQVGGAGGVTNRKGEVVSKEVQVKYDTALESMVQHDQKADWTEATCAQVAEQFLQAAAEQKKNNTSLPEAHYNAGLAYQRCGKTDQAKAQFQEALAQDPKFHRALVQMVLYDYHEKGDAVLDATIQKLQDAVIEAKFQNVDALVNLAMLQMKRNGPTAGSGCANDMDCAKLNVQRALAIDDGYMPAFNQLALYYMNQAREKAAKRTEGKARPKKRTLKAASGETEQLSGQMLDLAALVCSQAIRKNPNYAPVHNTLGLIQVEQKNINSAVQAFNNARRLDPMFFEAQMNYAAVNLSFRGFDQAEAAYRQALKINPSSYEAHLGLALALRGQINDSNWDKNLAAAQAELQECKRLAPNRAESYFNEAILIQEFKAKGSQNETDTIKILQQAKGVFDTFLQKAGTAPEYAEAVKAAKDRKEDIDQMIKFLEDGIKAAEEQKKAAAAAAAAPASAAPAPEPAPEQ